MELEPTTKKRALELKALLSAKLGYKVTISQYRGSMKSYYSLKKWKSMHLPENVELIQAAIREIGGIPRFLCDYKIDFCFKKGKNT